MKLRRKSSPKIPTKIVKAIFPIDPTPYYSLGVGPRPLHSKKVQTMYLYLFQSWDKLFSCGDVPNFLFAKTLKLHRCSADEWLQALRREDYLENAYSNRSETYKLREPTDKEKTMLARYLYIGKVKPYNPWIDRSWDTEFSDLWYPYFIDEVVDHYYSVYEEEHLRWYGERRIRPNGNPFRPMSNERNPYDHPLDFFEDNKTKFFQKGKTGVKGEGRPIPPPKSRKREISEGCDGQTGKARSREKTPQKAVKSWIKSKRFIEPSKQTNSSAGHISKSQDTPRRKGGIRRRSSLRQASDAGD